MTSILSIVLLLNVLSNTSSARAIVRRQDASPSNPLVTGCEDTDLTPANWNANSIDTVLTGTLGFGQSELQMDEMVRIKV